MFLQIQIEIMFWKIRELMMPHNWSLLLHNVEFIGMHY